ncbi:hypothetical protein ANN_06430 [Periplaneta americana]|uniref:Uncharacterized protein n=1 Tax=Periplaneta americana TaxID=6978 RepID=A0ABQ8TF98_PERAM|nr:hypothetical protein ANN_06430 [Periplaneta americana]
MSMNSTKSELMIENQTSGGIGLYSSCSRCRNITERDRARPYHEQLVRAHVLFLQAASTNFCTRQRSTVATGYCRVSQHVLNVRFQDSEIQTRLPTGYEVSATIVISLLIIRFFPQINEQHYLVISELKNLSNINFLGIKYTLYDVILLGPVLYDGVHKDSSDLAVVACYFVLDLDIHTNGLPSTRFVFAAM